VRSFDLKRARSLSKSDLGPHLEFVDLGGNGYAKVRLSDEMRTEFVCIPRPITRRKPDGGPIRYRTLHTAALWKSGERHATKNIGSRR
jgi:alkaline phosphatase D